MMSKKAGAKRIGSSLGGLYRGLSQAALACLCFSLVTAYSAYAHSQKVAAAGEVADAQGRQQSTEKSANEYLKLSLSQAMWAALAFEDAKKIRALLEQGADPNNRDEISLMTPLMVAENGKIAGYLLEAGADPSAQDRLGRTVMHHAVKMGEAGTIVRMLGEAGAKPGMAAEGIAGMTPLLVAVEHYAENKDRDETALAIRILIHLGADPNAVDGAGRSPLTIAAVNNLPDLIKLLVDLGADPQLAAADGKTPLDFAREAKADEAVKALAAMPLKPLNAN